MIRFAAAETAAYLALSQAGWFVCVLSAVKRTDMTFRVNRDRFSSLSFHRRENFLRAA
jgi:hypothetical protein